MAATMTGMSFGRSWCSGLIGRQTGVFHQYLTHQNNLAIKKLHHASYSSYRNARCMLTAPNYGISSRSCQYTKLTGVLSNVNISSPVLLSTSRTFNSSRKDTPGTEVNDSHAQEYQRDKRLEAEDRGLVRK